ncbi:arsenate reductase ArsC [Planctomycetota bacterium]
MSNTGKLKILFLCTANSCRSQMAEGWTRHLKDEVLEPYSAGVMAIPVDQKAVTVMAECGVDISGQQSKQIDEVIDIAFDIVITVCTSARRSCPVFSGTGKVVHVPFKDPPSLALNAKSEDEALAHYRSVRDNIKAFIQKLPDNIIT